jgi:23S rRNA pseudouridine1911/1915/1917 synthase
MPSRRNRPTRPARSYTGPLRILYEDNHLLGVYKPGGWLVQGDRTGDPTLLDAAKGYLKEKYRKPGNVFVGLVHRLDRPASGVVLFARTSKAASRLAKEFQSRRVEKTYLAVVVGTVREPAGELRGHVERVRLRSRLSPEASDTAKESVLTFRRIASTHGMTLLEVQPTTGRHHQIRLQLSAWGHPIAGDLKYGAPEPLADKTIALHALRLAVAHPVTEARVVLETPPPQAFPWTLFG